MCIGKFQACLPLHHLISRENYVILYRSALSFLAKNWQRNIYIITTMMGQDHKNAKTCLPLLLNETMEGHPLSR